MFEKFIKTCLEYYKLDPCHYFSAPGLSWDAMVKMTKVELKLMSDIDMHLFIEKGMRGVISYICKRYSKINDCDSSKEEKSIIYWDANHLYGWGMNQPLPYGRFDWLNKQELNELDLDSISENDSKQLLVNSMYNIKIVQMYGEY